MEELPDALVERAFSTSEALGLGVRPRLLRDAGLTAITRGSRSVREPHSLVERATAFLVAMHGDVALSHVSAAQLWNLPLPRELQAQDDLDVMCGKGVGPVRPDGCLGHRGLERRTVVRREGVPVTSLIDTWVDLGEVLGRG